MQTQNSIVSKNLKINNCDSLNRLTTIAYTLYAKAQFIMKVYADFRQEVKINPK